MGGLICDEDGVLAAEAIALELTLFDQDRCSRPDARSRTYRVLAGRVPVVLSAPHSVQQARPFAGVEGALHRSEPYTGPLAIQLHRATGAWAIYATRTARRDPNHLPFSTYKRHGLQALVERAAPRFILDLHGARTGRFAVAIGTSPALRAGRGQAVQAPAGSPQRTLAAQARASRSCASGASSQPAASAAFVLATICW